MDLSQLLRATSRTFALGIELLPSGLREQVRVAYLVLRVSDYLEDNRVMDGETKIRLLELWHRVLHQEAQWPELAAAVDAGGAAGDPIPDLEAVRHVGSISDGLDELSPAARELIARHAGDSTLGMARWVARGPVFETVQDLDDYMHEVAGRVGYLLTDLFALWSPSLQSRIDRRMELGREFGLALQTVNVIRGLSSDHERGWIFVPATFLDGRAEPRDIFDPDRRALALEALDRLVTKAERHFDAAAAYVTMIPRRHVRIRLFCLLPLFFGVRTLAMSRANPDVLTGEVKITRKDVRTITRNSSAFGISNQWIRWYSARLLQQT
ncbi:MAG: squalene/phytoene synthase family protein [Gemmatimonadetes bacterium]|nr:squalene/phytoene synthase family protein [Gemmatimonadota bacterium]